MLQKKDIVFYDEPQGFYMPGELIPGQVDIRHFRLLMSISSVSNEKMYKALEDILVRGKKRKEACECHGVTQGYLSVKYRHVQMISQTVHRIFSIINTEENTRTE